MMSLGLFDLYTSLDTDWKMVSNLYTSLDTDGILHYQ